MGNGTARGSSRSCHQWPVCMPRPYHFCAHLRHPHPDPWNLSICYITWKKGCCRYNEGYGPWNWEIILDYLSGLVTWSLKHWELSPAEVWEREQTGSQSDWKHGSAFTYHGWGEPHGESEQEWGQSLGVKGLKELNLANNLSELGKRLIPGASRKKCNLADTLGRLSRAFSWVKLYLAFWPTEPEIIRGVVLRH